MKKPAILYVDDEPAILLLFERMFESHYAVHTASSAKQALEILEQQEIRLVPLKPTKKSGS